MAAANLTGLRQNVEEVSSIIEKATGQKVRSCYQCGECSGGCPIAFSMEHTPRQIMRFLQLGQLDKALSSGTIWMCASCSTCSARCPRGVDLASIMDALREMALKQPDVSSKAPEQHIRLFHDIFLNLIRKGGRLYELGLIRDFNLRSGKLLKDADKGPAMFLKGKIGLLPHKIQGTDEVSKIFERVQRMEGDSK